MKRTVKLSMIIILMFALLPFSAYAQSCTVPLLAGQTIEVGLVTVEVSSGWLYVTYATDAGWVMTETHLYVGQQEPVKSAPGQFPYKDEFEGLTNYQFQIQLSEIGLDCGAEACFAAHAVVELRDEEGNILQEETAWGEGEYIRPDKNWAMFFVCDIACETYGHIVVQPTTIDFGNVFVGAFDIKFLYITNDGEEDLVISGLVLSGDAAFYSVPTGEFTVEPGLMLPVGVTFNPMDQGDFHAILTIESDDPENPNVEVDLSGSAETQPVSDIAIEPNYYDFGDVAVGDFATVAIEIYNYGDADLYISEISLFDSASTDFSIDQTGPAVVAPMGKPLVINVTFDPSETGSFTNTLLIYSDDPDTGIFEVGLAGEGVGELAPDIDLDPDEELGFRAYPPPPRSFTINNLGNADLRIDEFLLTGRVEKFKISLPDTPLVISPGGSHSIEVTCLAEEVDFWFEITLVIFSNDTIDPVLEYLIYYDIVAE